MPPRTANSPRFSTKSTREYPPSTSRSTISDISIVRPTVNSSGATSPKPEMIGARRARIVVTIMRASRSCCLNALSVVNRLPTVSARGERRSWGNVSQAGKIDTSSGLRKVNELNISSASRPVAQTTITLSERDAAMNGASAGSTAIVARRVSGSSPNRGATSSWSCTLTSSPQSLNSPRSLKLNH